MPTETENVCCHFYEQFQARLVSRDGKTCKCITETTGFNSVCIDMDVAEMAYYEFREKYGPHGDDEECHELYRHLAYRRLTRWIFKKLGRYNRKVLPSCTVNAIRQAFPKEEDSQYTGFKYPFL